jgi:hypothetical protein
MPFEEILINLKRELIRTFAVVDEWFDKEYPLSCYKPSNGGWCINEVLEHIMLTNHFLLTIIDNATRKALRKSQAMVDGDGVAANYTLNNPALLQIAQPDSFVWQRPEHHQPTGRRSLQEVRREIRNQLDTCLLTLELLPNGEGTRQLTSMSVNNLGKLDVYEFIYFLSLHAQRHLQQMRKVEEEALRCLSV